MAGADHVRASLTLLAALSVAGACTPHPQPVALPPQTVTQAKPEEPPPTEPLVAAPEKPKNETIVIEHGAEAAPETTTEDLVAAARAERERRRTAPPPNIVLDNKSLAKYSGGQLTVSSSANAAAPADATAEVDALADKEKYWRGRALEARQRWHDAVEAIGEHEKEAAALRTRFYAEDDPYVRDGQIKPAWDRELDQLAQAKRDAQTAQEAVAQVMEEGNRDGAWPGWLREGLELEPPLAPPLPSPAEPAEPKILQDPPRDPNSPP